MRISHVHRILLGVSTVFVITITLPAPTRSGYTFNGWYEDAAGTVVIGGGGASYTPAANITLYVKWIEIEDPVDPGDGSITYIQGRDHIILDDEGLIIKINYPLDKFSKLLFDNVELHKQYYELGLGSIIITVYNEYLDSLNGGEHTLFMMTVPVLSLL